MSIAHKVNGSWQKTAGLPPVDSVLSSTSQNPLENRQIYAALADKITASVSNLVNYYKKSETYTQAEVRQLIGAISTLSIKVVAALPTTDISATTIYWVGPDATTGKYDQYIYSNNTWVKTGDTSVNLGDYVTTEALELAIADFLTEDDIEVILANYYTKTEVDTLLNGKQDSLTFDNAPTEDSTNVVKSGGVYSAVGDVYKVMGENGAKNLLPNNNTSKTINGITYTVNDDGSVTANGTATANAEFIFIKDTDDVIEFKNLIRDKTVTLSGCPSGGGGTTYTLRKWGQSTSGTYYDTGDGVTFTADAESLDNNSWNFQIRVYNGVTVSNLTFYPMLRLASDTDDTYQPYAKTNQQLTEDKAEQTEVNDIVNVLGAKNLLPFDLEDIITNNTAGTWSGKTFTQTGSTLKFTLNDDGSITVNGTANSSGTATLFLYGASSFAEKNIFKGMFLNGCPSGGTTNGYSLASQGFDTSATSSGTDYRDLGSGVIIGDKDYLRVYVRVQAGVTVDNLTFYPMIRLASITDDTYEPYAKTNQQLTESSIDWNTYSELGAVNMLPNNATTQTVNGITFTVNDDGSVTANGTSTGYTSLVIAQHGQASFFDDFIGKPIKLSGCPSDGASNTYKLRFDYASGNYVDDVGEGVIITPTAGNSNTWYVEIGISGGVTVSNLTFKPMITVPSYNGDYVPYAKSNKELTEDVSDIVKGGAYVYTLPTYFYHIAITASIGSGQYIKLVTIHGELNLATSSSAIRIPTGQKVLLNQSNDASTWTYSLDGLTANLNSTGHLVGYIISNHPVTFTVVDTSTPEAHTLDTLNLALLSNS